MDIRELDSHEWTAFFNAFSRHYRGQCFTVELSNGDHTPQIIARKMPLIGITAEHQGDAIRAVEIILGDAPYGHLTHVVRNPTKVWIAQVTNGADELLLIDAADGPTTRIDFSPAGIGRPWSSDTAVTESADSI